MKTSSKSAAFFAFGASARPAWMACALCLCAGLAGVLAADAEGPRELRNRGAYAELARLSASDPKAALRPLSGWLAGEALLELNRLAEVLPLAERFEKDLPRSMTGAFLRFREAQFRGDTASARAIARERTQRPDVSQYWWGRDPTDWVLLGRLRLASGEDAKKVLESCFERALKEDGKCEEAFEAIAGLALERGDAELGASKAREGLKRFNANPRLLVQLGRALEWTSGKEATQHWVRALEINPGESSARCALAEAAFRIEDAAAVREQLSKLQAGNPEAAAFRLADVFLKGDDAKAEDARKAYAKNAWVLHRAGAFLSSRYRFADGSRLQRAALELDPEMLSAKRCLAEDLLRTGHAQEAWSMLEALQKEDGYDVATFNLLELRDRVAKFKKIETPHFEIHMEETEAEVYGDRVQGLLERAHAHLTAKYGVALSQRTVVEVFPEQKDFAVRTFGVPGGDGYLGVCFGPVITAPSPASPRASGHSWEATLWHEFTHTVTLAMTHNKMPRWLSEGISVHEEQRANPAWGQRFKPRYASRLFSGKLTPIELMAEPFRSGEMAELDFAYFQSGLLVDWMVEKAGMPALKALLSDIAKGSDPVVAMGKRFGPASKMNEEFGEYAANWAVKMGGDLRFKAAPADVKGDRLVYEELIGKGAKALAKKDWEGACVFLETAAAGAPAMRDPDGAYPMLARAYRELGLDQKEAQTWERALRLMADLPQAHERLIELYVLQKAWPQVEEVSARSLGVRPMSLRVLESLLDAQEAQGRNAPAVESCRKALTLDPARAPRWNSRLGRLLEKSDPTAARQHLFDALERNPRDQKALEAFRRVLGSAHQAAAKGELAP